MLEVTSPETYQLVATVFRSPLLSLKSPPAFYGRLESIQWKSYEKGEGDSILEPS